MQNKTTKILSYLQTILAGLPVGSPAKHQVLEQLPSVPVWINHAARFTKVRLSGGYEFILAEPEKEMAADRLLALYRITQQSIAPIPLILVTDQQRHQVRSALRRAHIGLVRTGSFLFAPQFGLHIKDSLKSKLEHKNALTIEHSVALTPLQPQEQIFLVAAILHSSLRRVSSLTQFVIEFMRIHSQSSTLKIELKKILGCVSRAVDRFKRYNLVAIQRMGKEVSITFSKPEVLWDSLCRNSLPLVTKTFADFSNTKTLTRYCPLSSISALSRYSDLLSPKIPTFAMSRTEWKSFVKKLPKNQEEPTAFIEVWKTNPRYLELNGTVNPLLLALNCRRDTDERVRIAIREMLAKYNVAPDSLWML